MYFYDFGIQAWLTGFAILTVLLLILWRQKRRIWPLLFFSVFWLYLLLLVSATLFPIPINGERWAPAGMQPWQFALQRVNLIPFKYLMEPDRAPFINIFFGEIMNNIVLSIPFGFGINFLTHIKPSKFIWLAVLAGFSIETMQLVIALIFGPNHNVDITDVLLNGLGALLGYAFFHLYAWLHRHGLGAYIDEIMQPQQLGGE